MKNSLRWLSVMGMSAVLAAPAVQAQQGPPPTTQPAYNYQQTAGYQPRPVDFYLNAGLGGNLVQDLHIRGAGGGKNSVDPGYRADVAFGIRFNQNVAAEFETGVSGNWLDTSAGTPLSAVAQRAYLTQSPALANLILSAPLPGGFTPYIGAGAGGILSTLTSRLNGDWDADTDITFAYQGTAGLKYAINRNIEVGLAYKFLGTLDHTWFGDDAARVIHAGNVYNHSILATFTWNF